MQDIEEPQYIRVKNIYGYTIIGALIVFFLAAVLSAFIDGFGTSMVAALISTLLLIHWFFGGIIWIVWSVIESIKRKMKGHYLYIADI